MTTRNFTNTSAVMFFLKLDLNGKFANQNQQQTPNKITLFSMLFSKKLKPVYSLKIFCFTFLKSLSIKSCGQRVGILRM